MQVRLNIEEDTELRLYIKDCIRNAIKSIVREELVELTKQVILNELKTKINRINDKEINRMIKDAILAKTTFYNINLKQLIQKEVHDQFVLEMYGYKATKDI